MKEYFSGIPLARDTAGSNHQDKKYYPVTPYSDFILAFSGSEKNYICRKNGSKSRQTR
jgi:hypothetical protein